MKKKKGELTIKDFLSLIFSKIWIILLVSVVLAVGLAAHTMFIKKDTYTRTASVMLGKESFSQSGDIDYVNKMVDACIEVMMMDDFLIIVADDINTDPKFESNREKWGFISEGYIRSVTTVTVLESKQVFRLTVTTHDPTLSYAIASRLSLNILHELPGKFPYSEGVINFTIANSAVENPELAPNPKPVTKRAVIGFIIGFVLSSVAVLVAAAFDVTIKDKKKIEDYFDIPVIGVIPDFEVDSDVKEA